MFLCCFFFQAEDGIRDGHVTGVQTCALPIFGDELALPISQEGAGMSACPAWGKVVNDGIEPFMYRRGIGPEVRAMCLSVFVRTQDLDGGFIRMQDMLL